MNKETIEKLKEIIFLIFLSYIMTYSIAFFLISETTNVLSIPIVFIVLIILNFFICKGIANIYINKLNKILNENLKQLSKGLFYSSLVGLLLVLIIHIYTIMNVNAQLSGLIDIDRSGKLALLNSIYLLVVFGIMTLITSIIDSFKTKKFLRILLFTLVFFSSLIIIAFILNYLLNILFFIISWGY